MRLPKPISFLSISLVSFAGFLLSPTSDSYLALARQADYHLDHREYGKAIQSFKDSLALEPNQPEVRQKLVETCVVKKQFESALASLDDWLRLAPTDPRPQVAYGKLMEEENKPDEAIDHFQQALSIQLQNKEARRHLAQLYIGLGRLDEAKDEYAILIAQDDADQQAHFELGEILAAEDATAAKQHLERAAELRDDDAVSRQAEETLAAVTQGEKEQNPAYAAASLGVVLLKNREITLASRSFRRATEIDSLYADAHAYLGYTLLLLHEPEAGRQSLAKAIDLSPSSAFAHQAMGEALREVGQTEPAIDELEKAEALNPSDPVILSDLASTYLIPGDLGNAEAYFSKAADMGGKDPTFAKQLAHFYLDRLYKVDRGLSAARRLVELEPNDGENLDLLGWALYLNGQTEQAEATLAESLQLAPYAASTHYHLAVLWQKTGQRDKAKWAYERAADLDSDGFIEKKAQAALNAYRSDK